MYFLIPTFNLLFWCFDVAQHPRHVDAVPVHVLEEDVCISSCQSACLVERLSYTLTSPVTLLRFYPEYVCLYVTLRKASFCSRCLLIMGVTWSVSQLGPSLSAPPHQSSSLLYSCSRLSNTLHTFLGNTLSQSSKEHNELCFYGTFGAQKQSN